MNTISRVQIVNHDDQNQDQYRQEVRELIVQSFAAKFEALVRLNPAETANLLGSIWTDQGNSPSSRQILALDGNQVVGVLYLKWSSNDPVQMSSNVGKISFRELCKQYGLRNVCTFMAGMIALDYKPRPQDCYIEHLAVAPSHRKQGIARQLLIAAQKLAIQHPGCERLSLHVSSSKHRAIRLYHQMNFIVDSTHTSAFRKFLFREPEWTSMIWPISIIQEDFHCLNNEQQN